MLTGTRIAYLVDAGLKLRDRSLDEGRLVFGDLAEAVNLDHTIRL